MSDEQPEVEPTVREFVARARAEGQVWGLRSEGGWAYCESSEYEDTDVIVFWSARNEAEKHSQGDWADHQPTAIPLEEFILKWLPGMDEDGVLIGPDWNPELVGPEIEPADLADELDAGAGE